MMASSPSHFIPPEGSHASSSKISKPSSKNHEGLTISIPNDDSPDQEDCTVAYDSDSSLSSLSSLFDTSPPSSPSIKAASTAATTQIKSTPLRRSARKSALIAGNPTDLLSNLDKELNTKSNIAPSNKRKLKHDGDPGSETKKTSRKRIARPSSAPPNRKKAVSQAKSTDNLTLDKPEAFGEPPIWADKRQALCETLPYYRAYQSGAYASHNLVYGFLYDKEVGARDVFTDQVYIARVGGGKTEDSDGNRVIQKDQNTSTTACSFVRNKDQKSPVAIIAGFQNSTSPVKLVHRYNVLDWFHVTDVWCERSGGYKVWMVRMEKIDLATTSWWLPQKDASSTAQAIPPKANFQSCEVCGKASKEIYNQGWTCLETECDAFFRFSGKGYDDASLAYNYDFIGERTPYLGPDTPSLIPPLMTDDDLVARDAYGIESECKKGIVCPKCRCCSRRREWLQWSCENENCDFTYSLTPRPISIQEVLERDTEHEDKGKEFFASSISSKQMVIGAYNVFEYVIPDENGKSIGFVRHYKSSSLINTQKDGPNDLFHELQVEDFGLKRSANMHPGLPGEILTNHFSADTGAPYKYKVAQPTRAFKNAPAAVLKALARMTWAGKTAVGSNYEEFHDFNEVLTLAYFENMKIDYHDDGEKTLGPTICTLSLGCNALMSIRPKARSKVGGDLNPKKRHKPNVLVINLEHGDMITMHGSRIQEEYEHAVTPQGLIRFAMTCRYIDPSTLTPEARATAEASSALPEDFAKYAYDGDVNAKSVQRSSNTPSGFDKLLNTCRAHAKAGLTLTPAQRQLLLAELEACSE